MTSRCPDTLKLQTLLESDSNEDADGLHTHLETCETCRHTLESLAGDTTVWENTSIGLGETVRGEPRLRELMERLKEEETRLEEEDILSLLSPSDKPGVLGVLGEYEVHEVIGRGSMAVVFKAMDVRLNRVTALKVLSPRLALSVRANQRFIREAQSTACIQHENVVQMYAVGDSIRTFLAMEFIAGESVQERLDRVGPLTAEDVARIGLQTALGLAAAHRQGLIHRDIKPANLMLIGGSNPPFVKITDFGLARVIDDNPMTQHGVVIGTPEYMSPEQARGEGVDHRSDLFSLGSVLYAMATGTSPFRASTAIAVLRRVNDEEPTPVRTLRPDLPAWLATLIERLMAKNPAERFATADEVANLLQGYLVHLQTAAPAPALPGSPRVCEQTAKRNKRIARAAVLLGASVILSVIAGLMIYRNSPWFQANVWNVAGIGLAGIVFMAALVGFLVMRGRRSAPDELLVLLKCSSCQKEFKVKPSLNGTKVRCPSCGQLTS